MLHIEIAILVSITVVACLLLLGFVLEDRRIDKENAERKARFEKALERIFKADSLEEKIFRSDPDNDGKPFTRGQ